MTDQTIHIFIDVQVPADKRAAFDTVMADLVGEAEQEDGTLIYEWNFAEDDTTCHIHERYRDIPNGEIHVRKFAEIYAGRFFEAIEGIKVAVYGEAGEYIRGALDAAQPTYFSRVAGFNRF